MSWLAMDLHFLVNQIKQAITRARGLKTPILTVDLGSRANSSEN